MFAKGNATSLIHLLQSTAECILKGWITRIIWKIPILLCSLRRRQDFQLKWELLETASQRMFWVVVAFRQKKKKKKKKLSEETGPVCHVLGESIPICRLCLVPRLPRSLFGCYRKNLALIFSSTSFSSDPIFDFPPLPVPYMLALWVALFPIPPAFDSRGSISCLSPARAPRCRTCAPHYPQASGLGGSLSISDLSPLR